MSRTDRDLVTGVAWYRREQWPLLREVASDPDDLEETYEAWLRLAQSAMIDFAREGIRAERVDIDVEELVEWCRTVGRAIDGSARAAFARRQLLERHEREGKGTV